MNTKGRAVDQLLADWLHMIDYEKDTAPSPRDAKRLNDLTYR